jgi:hypothetical protein
MRMVGKRGLGEKKTWSRASESGHEPISVASLWDLLES